MHKKIALKQKMVTPKETLEEVPAKKMAKHRKKTSCTQPDIHPSLDKAS